MAGYCGVILGSFLNFITYILITCLLDQAHRLSHDPILIVFLMLVTTLCLVEGLQTLNTVERISLSSKKVDLALAGLTGSSLLIFLIISLSEYLLSPIKTGHEAAVVGGVISSCGILMRWLAIKTLKDNFVSLPQLKLGHRLVLDYPYKLMRHPSETGLMLFTGGIAVTMGSLIGLAVIVLILVPVTVLRIRREEAVLLKCYGGAYINYKRSVPMFIPKPFGVLEPRPVAARSTFS
jgi:protein-S-isoprenylcysteine O-methyltransferase Ste14